MYAVEMIHTPDDECIANSILTTQVVPGGDSYCTDYNNPSLSSIIFRDEVIQLAQVIASVQKTSIAMFHILMRNEFIFVLYFPQLLIRTHFLASQMMPKPVRIARNPRQRRNAGCGRVPVIENCPSNNLHAAMISPCLYSPRTSFHMCCMAVSKCGT